LDEASKEAVRFLSSEYLPFYEKFLFDCDAFPLVEGRKPFQDRSQLRARIEEKIGTGKKLLANSRHAEEFVQLVKEFAAKGKVLMQELPNFQDSNTSKNLGFVVSGFLKEKALPFYKEWLQRFTGIRGDATGLDDPIVRGIDSFVADLRRKVDFSEQCLVAFRLMDDFGVKEAAVLEKYKKLRLNVLDHGSVDESLAFLNVIALPFYRDWLKKEAACLGESPEFGKMVPNPLVNLHNATRSKISLLEGNVRDLSDMRRLDDVLEPVLAEEKSRILPFLRPTAANDATSEFKFIREQAIPFYKNAEAGISAVIVGSPKAEKIKESALTAFSNQLERLNAVLDPFSQVPVNNLPKF
jgi:hypothetical protein